MVYIYFHFELQTKKGGSAMLREIILEDSKKDQKTAG